MNTFRQSTTSARQSGVTLLELLIAMTISLVVSLAMIGLMANTLGTGTRTIEMSRLTAEMRTAMQIMTRDARRANFHGNYRACFGNVECRTDDSMESGADAYVKTISLGTSVSGNDCFFYWFDRDANGTISGNDDAGAFRRAVVGGVGVLQMTTTRKSAPSCNSGNYWTDLTDPDFVNVTGFTINKNFSFTDTISTALDTQTVDKIGFSMTGRLVRDPNISKTIVDMIRVRNDVFTAAP